MRTSFAERGRPLRVQGPSAQPLLSGNLLSKPKRGEDIQGQLNLRTGAGGKPLFFFLQTPPFPTSFCLRSPSPRLSPGSLVQPGLGLKSREGVPGLAGAAPLLVGVQICFFYRLFKQVFGRRKALAGGCCYSEINKDLGSIKSRCWRFCSEHGSWRGAGGILPLEKKLPALHPPHGSNHLPLYLGFFISSLTNSLGELLSAFPVCEKRDPGQGR